MTHCKKTREKKRGRQIRSFICTVKVIYRSQNLGLLYIAESKPNPKVPFVVKAPTGKCHCRFEVKINQPQYRDTAFKRHCFQKPSGIKVTGNIFYFYFLWYSYSTQLFCFLDSTPSIITSNLRKRKAHQQQKQSLATRHILTITQVCLLPCLRMSKDRNMG